jgi:hypothetical protein
MGQTQTKGTLKASAITIRTNGTESAMVAGSLGGGWIGSPQPDDGHDARRD